MARRKKNRKRNRRKSFHSAPNIIKGFRIVFKGGLAVKSISDLMTILRSSPHGHIAAVLGTAQNLNVERLLARTLTGPGNHHRWRGLSRLKTRPLACLIQ